MTDRQVYDGEVVPMCHFSQTGDTKCLAERNHKKSTVGDFEINCNHTRNVNLSRWSKLFPSYRRFLTSLQQTAFRKHSDKRRNCSKRAISPFATMFSNLSHIIHSIIEIFFFFDKVCSKSSATECSYERND